MFAEATETSQTTSKFVDITTNNVDNWSNRSEKIQDQRCGFDAAILSCNIASVPNFTHVRKYFAKS
jgi:hypothetical protein